MPRSTRALTEDSPLLPNPLPRSSSSSTLAGTADNSGDDDSIQRPITVLRGCLIVAAIGTLIFLLTSNVSLLTTIQSPIAIELDAFASASWFSSTYLIALTSVTPVAGRLCQIFSPRTYLFTSVVIFCVGLSVSAIASRLAVFLLGRAILGAGAAAITPVALILVTELTTPRRHGLFVGLVNTGYTTGVAFGAIIAGALEPAVGWRAVLWLQIPVALVAGTVVLLAIPKSSATSPKAAANEPLNRKLAKIDYLGVLTLTSSVVLLLYSLSLPHIRWPPVAVSILLLIVFLLIESRFASTPILPLSVLKSRGNLCTGIATLGLMSARWSVLFYTPVYAIAVRAWSPASAGLILLPTNGGFALGTILVGLLHVRRADSFYLSTLCTFVLFSAILLVISQIATPDSPAWDFVLAVFAIGFVTGASLNYSLAHVLHLAHASTHVIVIPLNTMFRGFSGSFGSAVGGGIFTRVLQSSLESGFVERGVPLSGKEELVRKLLGTPALVGKLEGVEREVATQGYVRALRMLWVCGSVVALMMTFVQAGSGWRAPEERKEGLDRGEGGEVVVET